ncbi:hypothetical protein LOTGIDRAFT_157865 [Lottia gigantea]|uniref:Uncharacterized protein n=1 Tax=Lottia gigantea TaxID=225164 RepID=V4AZN0_LOTGI|nr:hypothetical protein LOTGIDRAFT_157865 [Lottia gigantea]ESP00586.1 hypothetical protein LOTGIDRAFT_157865 [Lottia gigantea]
MECRWLRLKSLHQQILSGSPLNTSTDESKQLTLELKVLLGLEIGQCEKFPSRCLHCHQLLALTVLKMMFEIPSGCGSGCSQFFTALEPVLMKNMFSKDEFIRYSTQKFLVVVIKSDNVSDTDKSRILNALCEKLKIPDSPKEMKIILQLFSQVMSRKNGEMVNKVAFEILQKNLPGIFM